MDVDVEEVNKTCNQSSLDYIHHPISMQDINIAYFSGKTVKLEDSQKPPRGGRGLLFVDVVMKSHTQSHGVCETRG